jgi:Carboxypeptidase regulatory-like domain
MTRFMLKLLTFCMISLLIALAPGSSDLAQTECGGIRGRVTSSEGWVIPKASIQMIRKGVETAVTIQTDDLGEYSSCLSSGIYEVFAKAPGYKGKKRSKIQVDESSKAIIDFVMEHDGTVTDR